MSAKWLANTYSQYMSEVFTREIKPKEVDVLIAEVGDDRFEGHEANVIYRVQYDGTITDHGRYCAIGGTADNVASYLQTAYRPDLPLGEALELSRAALGRASDGDVKVEPANLEVALLEKQRPGRKFRRLSAEELRAILQP